MGSFLGVVAVAKRHRYERGKPPLKGDLMKIRNALTAAAVILGVVAPGASAHVHHHSYWRTYPFASSLCERVAAGHAPKRLAADAAQINAACTTLKNSYTQALTTYKAAIAPIAAQVKSALATVRAAHHTARQTGDWTAYQATVKQTLATLKGLRAQERAAQQAYVAAIRAARQTFWNTIHALRGAGALPADSGNPAPPEAPHVPSRL
jgi:hypothetical protein